MPKHICSTMIVLVVGLWCMRVVAAEQFYFNDFEGEVGTEWSNATTDVTPLGDRRFLGQHTNNSVLLELIDLPAHNSVTLEFDLFVIRSWDGELAPNGPDRWRVLTGRTTLLSTTFSNIRNILGFTGTQSYPNSFPGTSVPAQTSAAEINTLGYTYAYNPGGILPSDSVYRLSFTFPHFDDRIEFLFGGSGLQSLSDESWGIDNVRLSIVPEPMSTTVPIVALAAVAVMRRRREFPASTLGLR